MITEKQWNLIFIIVAIIFAIAMLILINTINIAYQNYQFCIKELPIINATQKLNSTIIPSTNPTIPKYNGCPWNYKFNPSSAPLIENAIELILIGTFVFILVSLLFRKPKPPKPITVEASA